MSKKNTNLKGRATATFNIVDSVVDGVLTITVTADVNHEDSAGEWVTARGTVALGKAIAELGKIATPISASERRFGEQVAMYQEAGLSLDAATDLASQVNSL